MAESVAFESSWKKKAERENLRIERERVLEKAKSDYERAERKKEDAKKRGEDTWMLPSIDQRLKDEQESIKPKKKKKEKKRKKDKKEKKKKKKEKKKKHASSSDSSSDSEDDENAWVEKSTPAPTAGVMKGPKLERDSWMLESHDLLPCFTRDDLRQQKQKEKEEEEAKNPILEEPGQHALELNPYWKDGGTGVPEEDPSKKAPPSVVVADGGVSWWRKAYKRCEEQAKDSGKTLEEVAAHVYGSLEYLESKLMEAEKLKKEADFAERQKGRARRDAERENERRGYRAEPRDRFKDRDPKDKSGRNQSSDINDRDDDRQRYRPSTSHRESDSGNHDRSHRSGGSIRENYRSSNDSRDKYKHGSDRRDDSRSRSDTDNRDRRDERNFERSRDDDRNREQSRDGDRDKSDGADERRSKYAHLFMKPGDDGKSLKSKFMKPSEEQDGDDDDGQSASSSKGDLGDKSESDTRRYPSTSSWKKKEFMKPFDSSDNEKSNSDLQERKSRDDDDYSSRRNKDRDDHNRKSDSRKSMFAKPRDHSDEEMDHPGHRSNRDSKSDSRRSMFAKPRDHSDEEMDHPGHRSNRDSKSDSRRSMFAKPRDHSDEEMDPSGHRSSRDSKSDSRRSMFAKPRDHSDEEMDRSGHRSNRDSKNDSRKSLFAKPRDDSDEDNDRRSREDSYRSRQSSSHGSRSGTYGNRSSDAAPSWKKKEFVEPKRKASPSKSSESSSSSESESEEEAPKSPEVVILSEAEMNKLGAKLVKAEIMGNTTLAAEIKSKMEAARKAKASIPKSEMPEEQRGSSKAKDPEENLVVLTRMDKSGMAWPVEEQDGAMVTQPGKKRRKKLKVATHDKSGKRERYFGDDDRHDLRALVEREKKTTASDQNSMFSQLAGKSMEKTDDDYQIDDVLVKRATQKNTDFLEEGRQRMQAMAQHRKMSSALEKCTRCLENTQKHLIIALGLKVYLCLPPHKSMCEGHCLIVPMQHVSAGTAVDEDVWAEIQIFRKGLTKMFEKRDEDVAFMETAMHLDHHPHMYIECVPMPRETGDMAPIYFKKAIQEVGPEWAQNKKLVDLSQKDIRHSVPKGFPYFSVDFGLQGGFAHVIEDERSFAPWFGREIVGGMVDCEPTLWRKPHKEKFEEQRQKSVQFSKWWQPYDWTQRLKEGEDSD